MCKTLLFLRQIVQVLEDECEKNSMWYDLVVDILQIIFVWHRVINTYAGINLLRFDLTLQWHYKAPIGKETVGVSEQIHSLHRLVYILTYCAVGYVYGSCVVLLHTFNE